MKPRVVATKRVPLTSSLTNPDNGKPSTAGAKPTLPTSKSATYTAPTRSGSAPRVASKAPPLAPTPKIAFDNEPSVPEPAPAKSTATPNPVTEPSRPSPAPQPAPTPVVTEKAPTAKPAPVDVAAPVPSKPPTEVVASPPKPVVPKKPSEAPTSPPRARPVVDDTPEAAWPTLSEEDMKLLAQPVLEARGGEYLYVFPDSGHFACRRCRNCVARPESKIRAEGGYAAFKSYCVSNLSLAMTVGRRDTQMSVFCVKCKSFIGILTSDLNAGPHLRANSRALWYTKRNPPPTSLVPADTAFEALDGQSDGDDFEADLEREFQPR